MESSGVQWSPYGLWGGQKSIAQRGVTMVFPKTKSQTAMRLSDASPDVNLL